MISYDGIPYDLLRMQIPSIRDRMNDMLKVYGGIQIMFLYDGYDTEEFDPSNCRNEEYDNEGEDFFYDHSESLDESEEYSDDKFEEEGNVFPIVDKNRIIVKKNTFDIRVCRNDEVRNTRKICCGFERTMIDIVFRIAIDELSIMKKPDILIIDEGFTAVDKKYITKIDNFFNMVKEKYHHVIIISHNSNISECADYELKLGRPTDCASHVNNAIETYEI